MKRFKPRGGRRRRSFKGNRAKSQIVRIQRGGIRL